MKISVVTVCLNSADTIRDTIESVINQKNIDLEYIIMDGKSTDGTLEIIEEYAGKSYIKFISEKDSGLYNAMNKALSFCSGDYVIFLNSGDTFLRDDVLARVGEAANEELIYGNVLRVFGAEELLEKYSGKYCVWKLLLMGKMPCHQGIFTRTDRMKQLAFDEQYRICADFDFLVRCQKEKVTMQYVDIDISRVDCTNGISSQHSNLNKMRIEDDRSMRSHFPCIYWTLCLPKMIARRIKVYLYEKRELD